jgi:uncharacterized membrane protein YbhN (UPF0104 family)
MVPARSRAVFSGSNLKKIIQLLLLALTAASLYVIINNNLDVIESASSINMMSFGALLTLNIIFLFLFALTQYKILYYRYRVEQSWHEWFGLASIAALYNQVLPAKAGTLIRSAYLKTRHKLPFSHFGISMILQILYTAVVAIGFAAVVVLLFMGGQLSIIERALLAILLLIVAASMLLFEAKITKWISLKRGVPHGDSGRGKQVNRILLIILAYISCRAIMFYFAFDAIGYTIPISYCFLIAPVVILSNFVSVLPGNIGIKELLIGFILNALGYELSLSLLAAFVDRGATLIITVCSAIIFKIVLFKSGKHG